MLPSASPLRGICQSRRVIGNNDTKSPSPKQAENTVLGIAACPATAHRDASSQHTEDANPIPPISWLVSLEEKHSVPHSQPRVLSFLAVVRLPSYTYCHPGLHSLPAAEDHGQMTTTTFDHPRLECNRIIWHINKHNVAHYLYFYGTIYILMWHIKIYNMPQYTIYCATLINIMCHINLSSSHWSIDSHPYQETPSHVT